MRLINTNSLELVEFFAGDIPAYAILSHRWGKEEVTFQDWKSKRTRKAVRHKAGYEKIIRACEKAKEQGLLYIWCDTNCIDKSSSAELSEAINSMWAWYHNSAICYAYLQDVPLDPSTDSRIDQRLCGVEGPWSLNPPERYPKLKESEWFSRGWTLQELIAPSRVIFFSSEWEPLTTKAYGGVLIEKITNIPRNFLFYPESITNASVAKRMSWASRRRTTRVEDNAYCLLGMFGINMPLLYGEGLKAFQRLQEEIIRRSDDASILVWGPDTAASLTHLPLLAPSPICFRSAGNIELVSGPYSGGSNLSLSNRGLNLQAGLLMTSIQNVYLVHLHRVVEMEPDDREGHFTARLILIPVEMQDHLDSTTSGRGKMVRLGFPAIGFFSLSYLINGRTFLSRSDNETSFIRDRWAGHRHYSIPTKRTRLESFLLVLEPPIVSSAAENWTKNIFPLEMEGQGDAILFIFGQELEREILPFPVLRWKWGPFATEQGFKMITRLSEQQSKYDLIFIHPAARVPWRSLIYPPINEPFPCQQVSRDLSHFLMIFKRSENNPSLSQGLLVFQHQKWGQKRLLGFLVTLERDHNGVPFHIEVELIQGLEGLPDKLEDKEELVKSLGEGYIPISMRKKSPREEYTWQRHPSGTTKITISNQQAPFDQIKQLNCTVPPILYTLNKITKTPVLLSLRGDISTALENLPRNITSGGVYTCIPLMVDSERDIIVEPLFKQEFKKMSYWCVALSCLYFGYWFMTGRST